jgi:hypothetical protein
MRGQLQKVFDINNKLGVVNEHAKLKIIDDNHEIIETIKTILWSYFPIQIYY